MSMEELSPEEDTYSQIFSALKHPIRRAILRMLADDPESYSSLLNELKIDSPKLNYHLQGLGGLVNKAENGKYSLSTTGEAAVGLMEKIERPISQATNHRPMGKMITIIVIIGIALAFMGAWLYYDTVTPKLVTIEAVPLTAVEITEPLQPVIPLAIEGYAVKRVGSPQGLTGLFLLLLGVVVGGTAGPFLHLRRRLLEEKRKIERLEEIIKHANKD